MCLSRSLEPIPKWMCNLQSLLQIWNISQILHFSIVFPASRKLEIISRFSTKTKCHSMLDIHLHGPYVKMSWTCWKWINHFFPPFWRASSFALGFYFFQFAVGKICLMPKRKHEKKLSLVAMRKSAIRCLHGASRDSRRCRAKNKSNLHKKRQRRGGNVKWCNRSVQLFSLYLHF